MRTRSSFHIFLTRDRSPAPYISAAMLAVTTAAFAAYYHRGVWYEWFNATILVAVDQLEANVIVWKRRLHLEGGSNPDNGNEQDGVVSVKPIGVVRSVYRLCVGTPRQGLLSPQSRGRIELTVDNASDMLDGLEGFSHIWVFFVFHLNAVSKSNKPPTKIAPSALGGKKVEVLATRSPHRNNPIGMTLCKLDSIRTSGGSKKKSQRKSSGMLVVLNISGLDLVDGTPVLDVKPYVPHYVSAEGLVLRLPIWVRGGLEIERDEGI